MTPLQIDPVSQMLGELARGQQETAKSLERLEREIGRVRKENNETHEGMWTALRAIGDRVGAVEGPVAEAQRATAQRAEVGTRRRTAVEAAVALVGVTTLLDHIGQILALFQRAPGH
jgi:ferric-dicitrate binding protein FerR (iron transport regulator)